MRPHRGVRHVQLGLQHVGNGNLEWGIVKWGPWIRTGCPRFAVFIAMWSSQALSTIPGNRSCPSPPPDWDDGGTDNFLACDDAPRRGWVPAFGDLCATHCADQHRDPNRRNLSWPTAPLYVRGDGGADRRPLGEETVIQLGRPANLILEPEQLPGQVQARIGKAGPRRNDMSAAQEVFAGLMFRRSGSTLRCARAKSVGVALKTRRGSHTYTSSAAAAPPPRDNGGIGRV